MRPPFDSGFFSCRIIRADYGLGLLFALETSGLNERSWFHLLQGQSVLYPVGEIQDCLNLLYKGRPLQLEIFGHFFPKPPMLGVGSSENILARRDISENWNHNQKIIGVEFPDFPAGQGSIGQWSNYPGL